MGRILDDEKTKLPRNTSIRNPSTSCSTNSEKLNLPDSVARKRRKVMMEHAYEVNSRHTDVANHRQKCALDGLWSTLMNSCNVHDMQAYMEKSPKVMTKNNSLNCEQGSCKI